MKDPDVPTNADNSEYVKAGRWYMVGRDERCLICGTVLRHRWRHFFRATFRPKRRFENREH